MFDDDVITLSLTAGFAKILEGSVWSSAWEVKSPVQLAVDREWQRRLPRLVGSLWYRNSANLEYGSANSPSGSWQVGRETLPPKLSSMQVE